MKMNMLAYILTMNASYLVLLHVRLLPNFRIGEVTEKNEKNILYISN